MRSKRFSIRRVPPVSADRDSAEIGPFRPALSSGQWLAILVTLAPGAALRVWFIREYPQIPAGSLLYGDIAKNWLTHGVYGRTVAGNFGLTVEPTFIRLPGYPAFLALCFSIFGLEHFGAVRYVQVGVDLVSCLLIAGFVLRICGRRAAMAALLLAAFCPFTANYAAIPLPETLSIFCVALGFYSLAELRQAKPALVDAGFALRPYLLLEFCRLASPRRGAVGNRAFLRPRSGGAAVARICPVHSSSSALCSSCRASICAVGLSQSAYVSCHPTFGWPFGGHSAQSGKYGFNRWVPTWAVDYTSTANFYKNANRGLLNIDLLPARAFDSPAQYNRTRGLLSDYNSVTTVTPLLDARFASLARERIRLHPFRYYARLPMLRIADMWLYPRIEMLTSRSSGGAIPSIPRKHVLPFSMGRSIWDIC